LLDDYTSPPALWKRLLLGALLVVLASGAATAIAAFREVDTITEQFGGELDSLLSGDLAEADAGKPQTIMLIGSDQRPKGTIDRSEARSDTVMLVRLDPSKKATALMSLPRDLRVDIPGHGTDKLNIAYAIGGPKLTLRTVKRFTGLSVNHVVNVDFRGFKEAVNAIGCVYVDVDRRYFNDNTGGGERYATIDVKQGYQKMCGPSGLDYARYRHEDNDLVRSARQQDFLRQAKAQTGAGKLFSNRNRLAKIFGKYTTSDIRSRSAVLRLIKLAVASAAHPIREIHFEGKIGKSYVTASQRRVRRLADQFLGVRDTKGPRGETRREARQLKRRRRLAGRASGLEDAGSAGREQALQAVGAGSKIQVFYPRLRVQRSLFAGPPRVYGIRAPDGKTYNSYRMVIKKGTIGEFYGVQGTAWKDPPILKSPSEKRRIGGRTYELHFDGDRLRLIAWRTRDAVYWVSNTLLQTLSVKQMVSIARSCRTL
jgi:LCP family protein required for cell wall assembly